jgi:hypothetical protein
MNDIDYQLVFIGQERTAHRDALLDLVKQRFSDIGLNFDDEGELLEGGGTMPDWKGFPVAVWFGGTSAPDADEVNVVKEMLARGFSVFSVVASLQNYSACVPDILRPINGQVVDYLRIATEIMKAFRLVRKYRQAFISYKRDESSGVASQLFHELTEKGYKVFLDTISVDAGVDFQKALWSRMADVDLLILLDSPKALSSEWVYKEFLRSCDLGMGAVQLIWPNHKRTPGTEFSTPISLTEKDFENDMIDRTGVLIDATLEKVVEVVENERIRSLNARRTRLVEGLLSLVADKGVSLVVHPARQVDILKGTDKLAEVLPFVGVPDSFSVHEHEKDKAHDQTYVVYNGLGVDEQWAEHLKWLNNKATVEVFQVDDFGIYIARLA